MAAAIHHLSNTGPITGAFGMLLCIGAGYCQQPFLEKTGMYVCVIGACELAALELLKLAA